MKNMQARVQGILAFVLSSFVGGVSAAPGELFDQPAFLGKSVKSNIMINMDNSWSMEYRLQKSDEAKVLYPNTSGLGGFYRYYDGDTMLNPLCGVVPCGMSKPLYSISPGKLDESERLTLCPGYNVLAYDKNVKYEPWPGCKLSTTDSGLSGCPLMLPETGLLIKRDPFRNHITYPWNDDGDGVFEKGECAGINNPEVFGGSFLATVTSVFTDAKEIADKDNYRIWHTFYRSRELVAKGAMGQAVAGSTQRVGFMTVHGGVRSEIDDLVDENGDDLPYKEELLSRIYSQPMWWQEGLKETTDGVNSFFQDLFDNDGEATSDEIARNSETIRDGWRKLWDFTSPLRRGLDETGQYFSGVLANPDGGTYQSPILPEDEDGSCQQNFAVLMTDGFWSGDGPNVGNVDNGTNPLIRESDRDPWSNTLADVAMKYYLEDLAPALPDNVPVIPGVDENTAQHMVTFSVAYGVSGSITDDPADKDAPFAWPDPKTNGFDITNFQLKTNPAKIDDLRHAAWNSRGDFYSAHRPQSLVDALQEIFGEVDDRAKTASAATFNSSSLSEDTVAYVSKFSASSWYGDLLAYDIDPKTGEVSDVPLWSASEELSKPASVKNAREILTYNGSSGVAFVHNKLSQLQKDDLAIAAAWHNQGNSDAAVIDFIRGERNAEGRVFRTRHSEKGRMGDIVNSVPVHVKGAASNWPAYIEPGYASYVRSVRERKAIVYVGANDGMLHGFDAETGKELIAYIPHGIASTEPDAGMHYLLDKNYEHRYYVDGSPVAADAKINGSWRTVLLSGLGAGGKTIFALDITDPSLLTESNAANVVLWEFTAPDMGFTFAQPKVAKMNDGRWVAIVGNGYNNSADGQSKLFVLDLATGSLITTFETGVGSYSESPCVDCNGMSTATTFDIDGNGTADYIYAGDVMGNVWVINVTSDDANEWVFDSEVTYGANGEILSYSGGLVEPLFTTDGDAPITTELAVAPLYRQIQQNNHFPGLLVMFGTGQFMAHGDHNSLRTERFYSVLHSYEQYGLSASTPDDFVERVITNTSIEVEGEQKSARQIEAQPGEEYIAYEESTDNRQYGWYVDLPEYGERVIHSPKVVGDYVLFHTFFPSSSNACSGGAGGYLMAANYRNGLAPDELIDFNQDGEINEEDANYSGVEIDGATAGVTPLGNDGVGSTDEDGLEFFHMDLMGRQPLRSSWTDVR